MQQAVLSGAMGGTTVLSYTTHLALHDLVGEFMYSVLQTGDVTQRITL